MQMTFDTFKKYIQSESFRNRSYYRYLEMIERIIMMINVDEMKHFYPKYLFVDDKKIELYIFTERNIILGKVNENNNIEMTIYKCSDIVESTIEESNSEAPDIKLIITFCNGKQITFSNIDDTNSTHFYVFKEKINNIFKDLM